MPKNEYQVICFMRIETEYNKHELMTYKEAKKEANFTYPPRHGFFKIYSISEGTEKIHFNKKLKKAYDPEKIIKTKTISFRDSIYDYHLYIPDISHGQSILTEYVSNDDNSWIRMRFGHCEKLER